MIIRYDLDLWLDDEGELVKYEDHQEVVAKLEAKIEALEAEIRSLNERLSEDGL
jgi:chaperonin cofactor prefoldin